MKLNYAGAFLKGTVGRVLGPDTAGAWYEVVGEDYSEEETQLTLKPISPNDQRESVLDEFGERWVSRDHQEGAGG